jgi:hypothetical protein
MRTCIAANVVVAALADRHRDALMVLIGVLQLPWSISLTRHVMMLRINVP